ncbi:carbamoyltransferase [Rhodoblastus acidophilus]|uniref:carbamoyltransferase C-terminal domain-containing protein n=1 Tax=Candidatus Rhodoblastus alkanivorans TaxID=2954117 RepID=UPI001FAA617A|nr:carbamoyltransferase C-terminal domain-containing protein [Candidatus Rhodoblastus alkanivorans]MCI4680717.1 carbamoyltransferase [Candidatus Rhodoblastus alkanivorans]MDI4639626.1 carbamoyltransferase [Rhodoblastus acidophilus]
MRKSGAAQRFTPLRPRLASAGFRAALPLAERFFRHRNIHRSTSAFAAERARELAARLARGETVFLAGVSIGGFHNTGAALIEVTPSGGPRIICNNEEERYSGEKHSNKYPGRSLDALGEILASRGVGPDRIVAWLATYDYPLFVAAGLRSVLEEFPASLNLIFQDHAPSYDGDQLVAGMRVADELASRFGLDGPAPVIGVPHHDTHAYFSYLVSPFAAEQSPVMVAVVDGSGDCASISHYVGESGTLRPMRSNASIFDSLGMFYAVISSTQGGWTTLSSEGRYMGATAYGDMNRATNPYYERLRKIFDLRPDGDVRLNRSLANWPRSLLRDPYAAELADILGPPIPPEQMWNPDAVLRVEDIHHRPNTQERLDKAAATQLVFEDGLFHLVDGFIRTTGSDRLVLTGGAALNAVANMRLLEHFDEAYFRRALGRSTRLHLWVPPTPGDSGATIGAAYAFAATAGVGLGPRLEHAFYCGSAAPRSKIEAVLAGADDLEWVEIGDAAHPAGREAIADLMAFIIARNGVIAIFQGPAETGPRALGHRSILANPCNPRTREMLNERVKYREAIRPLAPMATLAAAIDLFELSDGAADDGYNAYNYMVLTVRAKARALERVPAVIHADGTARVQIVREHTDPVIHSFLKALGRRIGVEVAVNTSFNVGGPIAQTPVQAVKTLRRAKGMDGVFMLSAEGPAMLVWLKKSGSEAQGRAGRWLAEWKAESCAAEAGGE